MLFLDRENNNNNNNKKIMITGANQKYFSRVTPESFLRDFST